MNDRELELELRNWFQARVPSSETAPATLLEHVMSIPQTEARPVEIVFSPRRLALLAAAALVVASLIGSQLLGSGNSPAPSHSAPAATGLETPAQSRPGAAWTAVGSMHVARKWATATLLNDGGVLVAGGNSGGTNEDALASAEVYDPSTRVWSETGSMSIGRYLHTATLLPNGMVLVAGGSSRRPSQVNPARTTGFDTASAEIYDPATGAWTSVSDMRIEHTSHTATLLDDGRVLVAGGQRLEIYNPHSDVWGTVSGLNPAREQHTATLLRDGKVLIAGGLNDSTQRQNELAMNAAELFDPTGTGRLTPTGSLAHRRAQALAVLLSDGRVLVAGGDDPYSDAPTSPVASELYDPANGTWATSGDIGVSRTNHTLIVLADGSVLMFGGISAIAQGVYSVLDSVELFTSATGTWRSIEPIPGPRFGHTTTLLRDGTILLAGGNSLEVGPALTTAEIFDPAALR